MVSLTVGASLRVRVPCGITPGDGRPIVAAGHLGWQFRRARVGGQISWPACSRSQAPAWERLDRQALLGLWRRFRRVLSRRVGGEASPSGRRELASGSGSTEAELRGYTFPSWSLGTRRINEGNQDRHEIWPHTAAAPLGSGSLMADRCDAPCAPPNRAAPNARPTTHDARPMPPGAALIGQTISIRIPNRESGFQTAADARPPSSRARSDDHAGGGTP